MINRVYILATSWSKNLSILAAYSKACLIPFENTEWVFHNILQRLFLQIFINICKPLSDTHALAPVTASVLCGTISGCRLEKAFIQPSPGLLSVNGFRRGCCFENSWTLEIMSSFLLGKPFWASSVIHFTFVYSSSWVNTRNGPKVLSPSGFLFEL